MDLDLQKFMKQDGHVLSVNGKKMYALSDDKINGIEYANRYLTSLNIDILQDVEKRYPNKSKLEILEIAKKQYSIFNVGDIINSLTSDIYTKLSNPIEVKNYSFGFTDKDKIKYFKKRVNDKKLTMGQRNYANKRLKTLIGN